MASNELRRLRTLHNDLAKLYDGYTGATSTHRRAIKDLGPIHSGSSIAALQRAHTEAESKLTALRQEVDAAIAAIQKRATRPPREAASEATKNSINRMLARPDCDIQSVCQWILATETKDGFQALRDILRENAYADKSKLEELTGVPTSERTPEKWMAQRAEPIILAHEMQTMEPAQLAAVEELREVEASKAYLLRNFENLNTFLVDQGSANGGLRNLTSLAKWPGLPNSRGEDERPLLADGSLVQLASVH